MIAVLFHKTGRIILKQPLDGSKTGILKTPMPSGGHNE